MPICTKCQGEKDASEFVVDRQKKLGFRHVCRPCHVNAQRARYRADPKKVIDACREWRRKNPERRSATDRKWRLANYQHHFYTVTKNRAHRTGIPFDLTEEDFAIPDVCPVLGIPIRVNEEDTSRRPPGAPSIDKIIPELGYVKGNTRVISFRANRLKQNGTAAELRAIADYIERETRKKDDP